MANNACKFHGDRLDDGMTIYLMLAKPPGNSEIWSRYWNTCTLHGQWRTVPTVRVTSCSVCMDSRAANVWTAKKQKRQYISGKAAVTAGQILVDF